MSSRAGLANRVKVWFYRTLSERRRYPRAHLSVKATNPNSGAFSYYQATNISLSGMFLKAEEPQEVGNVLRLQFTLPTAGGEKEININAEVVRIQEQTNDTPYPSGMGVKFLDLSEDSQQVIHSFIKMKV